MFKMALTEDVEPEHIPLVAAADVTRSDNEGYEWHDTVHMQLLRSTRVLVHLYLVKLIVRLTLEFMEGSLPQFSVEVWQYEEEGKDVLLLSVYDAIAPCLPLFGGILSDSLLGTTRTTIGGTIFITIACVLFTLDALPYDDLFGEELPLPVARTIFIIGISFVFIGGAGFEANIDPLAAKHKERKGYSAVRTVYHSLFWFETIGISVAIVFVDTLEEAFNFDLFYGIGSILMVVAICIIVSGRALYIPTSLPEENVLYKTGCSIFQAISRRIKRKKLNVPQSEEMTSFLDYAKTQHGGSYTSVDTSYREQTRRMNLAAGNIEYPNITFPLISAFVILVTLPCLLYFYPKLDGSDTFKLTPLRKIGIGIICAGLSLICAAIVESKRKEVMEDGGYFIQTVNEITYNASQLNVLYQIPQYTFIGISEAVIRTSGSELAFTQSPDNMKGIVMGIYLLMSGLGSYLINLLITLTINSITSGNEWITDEMNDGCYDCLFYILTGLQILNLFYLYMISRKYSYKPTLSVKMVYQHVTFNNDGGVTVLDSVEGNASDVVPNEWEYVAILHRKSLPRCKMQYGTEENSNER
ncbi:solute carrier family 15 member 4-like isoform X2 [Antedon mediterranea]|uniref:solute carrier family 15 member 4-like isoform X2 n=1 Tax=Antedon mediterranea TaxID=105859 RepID=UPI003AF7413C